MTARKPKEKHKPSGRPMKFPGGSRPKTFRLPRLFYDEAVKGVEEYLKKFEKKNE